jgi:N-ethylmaleimide reductase
MPNFSYDDAFAKTAITRSDTEMSSFGKQFLANPDLVQHFKADAELNTPDLGNFYGIDKKGIYQKPYI